jgi:hypothetical protein
MGRTELLGLTKMLQSISDTKEKGSDTLRLLNVTKEG